MTRSHDTKFDARYNDNWHILSKAVKQSQLKGDRVQCACCQRLFAWEDTETHHTSYKGEGDRAGVNLFALCGNTRSPGTCHHWVHLKEQWTHDRANPVWRSGNHQKIVNSLQANYRAIVGQSPPPDFRSLDRDPHFPWIGLIVAGAIAVWVGGFIKVNPTAPKTWKMSNGPSITLPPMPDFKMPSIEQTPQTIVVQRRANVRSSPNGKILCQAEPNEQLRAIGSSDGWTKVKACNAEGFVFSKLVK